MVGVQHVLNSLLFSFDLALAGSCSVEAFTFTWAAKEERRAMDAALSSLGEEQDKNVKERCKQ